MSGALAIRPDQTYWTESQIEAYRAAGIKPNSHEQATLFLNYCQASGLDPFTRQIYLAEGKIMVSIDGLRVIARRTGEYQGQMGPQWCGPDGQWMDVWLDSAPPAAARVGVVRSGFTSPLWGVAMWSEFGGRGGTWAKMPAHMLAKVAESHALRKAFPAEASGLYTSEEMAQADKSAAPVVNTSHLMDAMPLGANGEQVDVVTGEVVDAEILEPGEQ